MATVDDPMTAWLDMIEQFQKIGLGSNAPELWKMMFAPMQQQLDLVQKTLEAQAEFQRTSACSYAAGFGGPQASREDHSRRW